MKKHYPKIFALLIAIFATTMLQAAPFIGNYVVGSGETYTSLNGIVNAMKVEGTSGHVTIKIKDGTYTENININGISTLSETSTLTIESNSGNPTSVILRSTSSYTVYLNNIDYITFKNLTFRQDYIYRTCLYIYNSENIEFDNCVIRGTTYNSSSTSYSAIYLNGRCDNFKLSNCAVSEGSYGIYSASTMKNMVIENCSFSYHYYGTNIYYVTNLIFRNNTLNNINSTGIYFSQNTDFDVNNNNINLTSGYNMMQYCETSSNGRNLVYNNIFYSSGNYGMYINYSNNLEFYHNTILSTSNNPAFYAYRSSDNLVFKNNLVASNGCQNAIRLYDDNSRNADIDYNAYSNSSPNCNPFYYENNTLSFVEWKNQTGYDMNSVYGQANFVNFPNDPKPQNGLFVNICNPIAGITKDINGVNRDMTNPDPGALEFNSVYSNDMALISLNSLLAPNCSGTDDIVVKVKNIGLNPVTTFKLEYKVNGNLIGTYNHGSTLAAYASEEITIGSYAFDGDDDSLELAITDVNGGLDADLSNNTLPFFRIYDPLTGTILLGENDTLKGIQALFNQISNGGICGDVHIKIKDGYYEGYEDVYLSNVKISNPDDRLFIESESGNADDVVLRLYSNREEGVFDFENVQNVTVQNLTLDANYDNCNAAIYFDGYCSNIELRNLNILGDSTYCEDVLYFEDDGARGMIVDNCTITGGDEIMDMDINGDYREFTFEFTNNTVMNWDGDFLSAEGYDEVIIHNNYIQSNVDGNEGIVSL